MKKVNFDILCNKKLLARNVLGVAYIIYDLLHQTVFSMVGKKRLMRVFDFYEMHMVVHTQQSLILIIDIARVDDFSVIVKGDIASVKQLIVIGQ